MANNIRIEEDLLGMREVPADAYNGVHTLRAIENFYISNSKISDIPEFVRGMVMVKKAAAMANKELQTIPRNIADTIIKACDEVPRPVPHRRLPGRRGHLGQHEHQ